MTVEELENILNEIRNDFIELSGMKSVTGWGQEQHKAFIKYLAERLSNEYETN